MKLPRHSLPAALALTLALAVRLSVWTAYSGRSDTFVQPDTSSYLIPGTQLLLDGSFPSYSRTPVYPLFLALAGKVLSPNPKNLALLQIAISLAAMGLIYSLCARLFDAKTALLALIFMALDLTAAISANHLLAETLFTFLLAACLLGVFHIQSHEKRGSRNLIAAALIGIGFSALTLCRPVAFALFLAPAIWLLFGQKTRGHNRIALVLCFCVCSMLLPTAWMFRNHTHTGVFFLSTVSSNNLYDYRAAWNISRAENLTFTQAQRKLRDRSYVEQERANLNQGELGRWKKSEGIRILISDPLLTAHQALDGLLKMYLGISTASIDELSDAAPRDDLMNSSSLIVQRMRHLAGNEAPLWIAAIKCWCILYLALTYIGVALAAIGLIQGRFSAQQRGALWLILIVIAYFTLLSIGAEVNSRFRVPIAPLLAILASLGWIAPFGRDKENAHPPNGG